MFGDFLDKLMNRKNYRTTISKDLNKLDAINKYKDTLNPVFPSEKIIKNTKYNEPVLLLKPIEQDEAFIYRLYSYDLGTIYQYQINLIQYEDVLKIADIQVLDKSQFGKGYGSLLLNEAIQYAKENNIKRIEGFMSYDDEEHHKRQIAFYSKHGFEIHDNKVNFEMNLV